MPEIQMQDVFWNSFADEVEKLSGWKTKAGIVGGALAGAAALGSSVKKGADKTAKNLAEARTGSGSRFDRINKQTAE